jgi:hypothetical protein
MLQPSTIYRHAPNLVARRVADEVLVIPICASGAEVRSIYSLDEVGGRIWELMDGQRSLAEVEATLVAEFETDAETAARDLRDFVAQLTAIGAIEEA